MQAVEAHQGQGHQADSHKFDGDALETLGAAGEAHFPAQAGQTHQSHRRPCAAEESKEKGGPQAVPPLGDEQRRAHGRAVGGDAGQILIHPPGELRHTVFQKVPQAGYHSRSHKGKNQGLKVAQCKVLKQLVQQPGQQRREGHHRR